MLALLKLKSRLHWLLGFQRGNRELSRTWRNKCVAFSKISFVCPIFLCPVQIFYRSSVYPQESHLPFDIHEYGARVLNKLSLEENDKSIMSFSDVVKGSEKHDIARTFSALLQLVKPSFYMNFSDIRVTYF